MGGADHGYNYEEAPMDQDTVHSFNHVLLRFPRRCVVIENISFLLSIAMFLHTTWRVKAAATDLERRHLSFPIEFEEDD